jgi:hypothetical protein
MYAGKSSWPAQRAGFPGGEAPSGFEPLYGEDKPDQSLSAEPLAPDVSELPADLQRVVARITRRERERR